jgi:hypothetical protein
LHHDGLDADHVPPPSSESYLLLRLLMLIIIIIFPLPAQAGLWAA